MFCNDDSCCGIGNRLKQLKLEVRKLVIETYSSMPEESYPELVGGLGVKVKERGEMYK